MHTIYASEFFNSELGFAYRFLDRRGLLLEEHTHADYFEYFFIRNGSVVHKCNGEEELLTKGDLLLMRPTDCHSYILEEDMSFEMINISFAEYEFEKFCSYIGGDLSNILLSYSKPPKIKLDDENLNYIEQSHAFLNFYGGSLKTLKMRLRFLLAEVIGQFFKLPSLQEEKNSETGQLLEAVLVKMNTQENVRDGMEALLRLSGFSHGHLCRLMKAHMDISPSAYISDLRLVYASSMLRSSDMDIGTISSQVGYSSTSHFIKAFKAKFNLTPHKYRKLYFNLFTEKEEKS